MAGLSGPSLSCTTATWPSFEIVAMNGTWNLRSARAVLESMLADLESRHEAPSDGDLGTLTARGPRPDCANPCAPR
jgi:hypothetical protein